MSPNDANGIANSVAPDQRAVWSGSALFAQAYLSENLGSLPCILSTVIAYLCVIDAMHIWKTLIPTRMSIFDTCTTE